MNVEIAKQLAFNLLEEAKVAKVYYVDDYLSFDGLGSLIKYIDECTIEQLRQQRFEIPSEILNAKEAEVDYIGQIQEWWNGLSSDEEESILNEIHAPQHRSEGCLRKLLDSKCIFCTPEDWENKYFSECLSLIQDNGQKTLLLFDYKLGVGITAEGESRNGLTLALKFSANDGVKENSYCGILSQEFTIDGEFQFRNDNQKLLDSWAFPIAKDRLADNEDYSLFIEGLNNLLWVGDVDKLSNITQRLINATSKRMEDEFKKILPLEFKQIIINSSIEEGCREIDTMLRLLHILFNKELQKTLSESSDDLGKFNEAVNSIRVIDAVTNESLSHKYDPKIVNNFFQDETFIPGETINKLLTPLQNGDVFCVDGKSYYVLLCQPCNISLRKNGRRGNDYDLGFLVPLRESKVEKNLKKELDSLINEKDENKERKKAEFLDSLSRQLNKASQGYMYKVKCTINDKVMCIAVNEYRPISLSLLDYCTFSESGEVIINSKCSENLHENQKQLCQNHASRFKQEVDFEHLLDDLTEEKKVEISPKVDCWFYSFLTKVGIKPKFENNQYIFPIKRYGHIQDPLASDLLTQLSHYISRAGLPNEFEK